MPLVYAGVCSHAPGITGRSDQADPAVRDAFFAAFDQMRIDLEASRPDAVVIVASERNGSISEIVLTKVDLPTPKPPATTIFTGSGTDSLEVDCAG